MTDDEAARELDARLIGCPPADCPICENHNWRVEVIHDPRTLAPKSLRNFAKEGEITRTCTACGYRQHFVVLWIGH